MCEITWQEGDLPPLVQMTGFDSIDRIENCAPCRTFVLATPTLRHFTAEQETVGRLQANAMCNLHTQDIHRVASHTVLDPEIVHCHMWE